MNYKPYICQTLAELSDNVAGVMGDAPKFEDDMGYYSDKDMEKVFRGFMESLDNLRTKLGEERYARIRTLTNDARAHFEADQEETNGRYRQGIDCMLKINELVRDARRARKASRQAD